MEIDNDPERDPEPIEDLFDYADDSVDFMSAESFPASDPPPPQPSITPAESGGRE